MHWENLTDYYSAWAIYLLGATGCLVATWLLIRRLPRAFVHGVLISLMVLLFTPFAIDSSTMILAPGIMCLGYGLITDGFASVKPVTKTMLLVWMLAMLLSLVYQVLTRHKVARQEDVKNNSEPPAQEPLPQGPIEPTVNMHSIELNEPAIRAER